jgi:hypothetical protein
MIIYKLILSFLYFLIPLVTGWFKRITIWKGICGGNGIPQPNEIVRALAGWAFYFNVGLILFFSFPLDLAFLGLLLGVVGITSIAPHIKMKKD